MLYQLSYTPRPEARVSHGARHSQPSEGPYHPHLAAPALEIVELDRAPVALDGEARDRREAAELQLAEGRSKRQLRIAVRPLVGEQKQPLVGVKPSQLGARR